MAPRDLYLVSLGPPPHDDVEVVLSLEIFLRHRASKDDAVDHSLHTFTTVATHLLLAQQLNVCGS